MLDLVGLAFFWMGFSVFGYAGYKGIGFLTGQFGRAIGLDFAKYVYIPYKSKGVDKTIAIRKPSGAIEYAFIISFATVMGGLCYKLSQAVGKTRTVEAKKAIVSKYRKYMKLGMFSLLFPIGCANEADAIVEFATHVALYYRTVTGVADLFGDISDVLCEVSDWSTSVDEVEIDNGVRDCATKEKATPKKNAKPVKTAQHERSAKCVHSDNCPILEHIVEYEHDCNTPCGGHHCTHVAKCKPFDDIERKVQSDAEPVIIPDPEPEPIAYLSGSDDDEDDVGRPNINVSEADAAYDERVEGSRRAFEEILSHEAEARERLARGETHFGLGYARDSKKLSGIWRRLKYNIVSWVNLTMSTTMLAFWYVISTIKIGVIKYRWWLLGGVTLIASGVTIWQLMKVLSPARVPEGGKKRNRAGKKTKGDTASVRFKYSTAKPGTHPVSGGSSQDEDLNWKQRLDDKKREDEDAEREVADRDARAGDDFYVDVSFFDRLKKRNENVKINPDTCTRHELSKAIHAVQDTWFDKDDGSFSEKVKQRREDLSKMFVILNKRFPKRVAPTSADKPAEKKAEQLRPGKTPIRTPIAYMIRTYYENKGPSHATVFPYNNCVYIPRHQVAGGNRFCLVVGGKEIELPNTMIIVKDGVDQVCCHLPPGLKQNTKVSFRAPKKGEVATLFWVDQNSGGATTQCVGTIGNTEYLGSDRSLEVVEFDGSSVAGSCGGTYWAATDGYCLGIHGIGADHVSKCPEFYPMSAKWIEGMQKASAHKATYVCSDDAQYGELISQVINDKLELSGLNY